MSERLLTTAEVADRLGVSPETILRWVDHRGLPAIRLTSRALRYDADELDAWLAEKASTADRELSDTRRPRPPLGTVDGSADRSTIRPVRHP